MHYLKQGWLQILMLKLLLGYVLANSMYAACPGITIPTININHSVQIDTNYNSASFCKDYLITASANSISFFSAETYKKKFSNPCSDDVTVTHVAGEQYSNDFYILYYLPSRVSPSMYVECPYVISGQCNVQKRSSLNDYFVTKTNAITRQHYWSYFLESTFSDLIHGLNIMNELNIVALTKTKAHMISKQTGTPTKMFTYDLNTFLSISMTEVLPWKNNTFIFNYYVPYSGISVSVIFNFDDSTIMKFEDLINYNYPINNTHVLTVKINTNSGSVSLNTFSNGQNSIPIISLNAQQIIYSVLFANKHFVFLAKWGVGLYVFDLDRLVALQLLISSTFNVLSLINQGNPVFLNNGYIYQINNSTITCSECPSALPMLTSSSSEFSPFNYITCQAVSCSVSKYFSYQSFACEICELGYTSSSDKLSCTPCAAGQYHNGVQGFCFDCGPGTTGSTNSSTCIPCDSGTYNDASRSTCKPCPFGTYSDATGRAICTNCDSGLTTFQTGSASSSLCVKCPAGTYTSNGICIDCGAGTYSTEGASSCTACPSGTYSFSRATSCITCALLGTRANSIPSASICSCPAGYQNNAGVCKNCTAGTYSTSGICNDCSSGSYSNEGAATCISCPIGTFTSTHGEPSCRTCPAGTVALNTGSTLCTTCSFGYTALNSYSCGICPRGTQSVNGMCTSCPAGTYSDIEGSTSCTKCMDGYYLPTTGATSKVQCVQCNPGFFSASGASVCNPCEAGSYSEVIGASFCMPCIAGTFSM